MSASDTGDFLRLVRSWLKIVAASGSNFSQSVAARAEFFVARKVLSQSSPDQRVLFQTETVDLASQ
jgi:hypothetical protein